MSFRVAINGCGRVGRALLRAYVEQRQLGAQSNLDLIQWCAINDRMTSDQLAHALRYDSTYGRFPTDITEGEQLNLLDQRISVLKAPDYQWPWADLGIDCVVESSGRLRKLEMLEAHRGAGAAGVILTAPLLDNQRELIDPAQVGVGQIIPSIPFPLDINHRGLCTTHACTTQAVVTLLHPILREISVKHVLVTEIHGYTNDQTLLDANHRNWRRARSATQSIVPTATQGIESSGFMLPQLKGKIQGFSYRVPTANVACVEVTLQTQTSVSKNQLIDIYQAALDQGKIKHLALSDAPLVSIDYLKHPASAIIDLQLVQTQDNLVKILAWYDNEWAYASRLLELLGAYAAQKETTTNATGKPA